MCFYKKSILSGIVLLSVGYFFLINCKKGFPEINVPGYKGGKVLFTRVGRELFQAFLNQKNFDKTEINKIIKKNEQSKFYHLYSAYCYGFDEWKKISDPYKKEKIRRTAWNIAIEFADNNLSHLKVTFFKFVPTLLWTGISVIALVFGAYSQQHRGTFNGAIARLDQFVAWIKNLVLG